MKNKKVIVINGFQRGGTNIVYNIFQSHPQVCSAYDLEIGQIISQNYRIPSNKALGWSIKRLKLVFYSFLNKKFVLNTFIVKIIGVLVDYLFYKYKLKNYQDRFNRFKYENVPYTFEEIKNSVLCLKAVHNDIRLTPFLSKIYSNVYFIGLIRNGYALCESWIRRGKSAELAGFRYRTYCEMMIKDSKKIKNYRIVKFENVIKNPFEVSTDLYKFAKLIPVSLEKLRFKSKAILTRNGEHKVKYGDLDAKYWFDKITIKDLIDTSINDVQTQKLSDRNKRIFEREVKNILNYFKYVD